MWVFSASFKKDLLFLDVLLSAFQSYYLFSLAAFKAKRRTSCRCSQLISLGMAGCLCVQKGFISPQPLPDSWLAFPYFWQNFKNCHQKWTPPVLWEMSGKREVGRIRKALEKILGCKMLALGLQASPAVQSDRRGYMWLLILRTHVSLESC